MNQHIKFWAQLVGRGRVSDQSDLIGLFQYFRPDGEGVEAIFAGHPFGDAILERIRKCYAHTREGYAESDAYFIPRPKESCSQTMAINLLNRHLLEMRKIAERLHVDELVDLIANSTPVRVRTRAELDEGALNDDSPEAWLYDIATDFMGSLSPHESPLLQLRDAMYSIANDMFLRNYLLWPLYADSYPDSEPFLPAF